MICAQLDLNFVIFHTATRNGIQLSAVKAMVDRLAQNDNVVVTTQASTTTQSTVPTTTQAQQQDSTTTTGGGQTSSTSSAQTTTRAPTSNILGKYSLHKETNTIELKVKSSSLCYRRT